MLSLKVFLLISLVTLVECKSSALYCTQERLHDNDVNRLHSIFTIKDKVYIRSGVHISKLWVYDINSKFILEQPVMAPTLFNGFNIVEFVATVLCNGCPPEVSDLVIVIGKPNPSSHHKFATFRMKSDTTFEKLGPNDLPKEWGLRYGEALFTLDDVYYGFFPEDTVTETTNGSNFHGFTFLPNEQIFSLKYYNEKGRHFFYRKLNSDGTLGDWKDTGIVGQPHVLNSLFYMKDELYAIDNDPQYMPRISHQIFVDKQNDDYVFRIKDIVSHSILILFYNCLLIAEHRSPRIL